ncbi:MFS transporter [Streptomyces iconiensis]|uniref:MFS transporter n=1 Tax=Streptomyces iconiensis TaxID=1384038 RepID=A0ABT6ZUK5_9ACTN|nr:MFS transporter [Streptomyces iconiensis]MDJ1132740.1 MFS transporter [Streptomyces iconiensis]
MTVERAAGGGETTAPAGKAAPSLWSDHDFRMLFAAAVVSKTGTHIGYIALPLVAIEALDASPGQVGLLGMLSTVAFLLIGLPAGAWVDRMRYRHIMIVADLLRTALLASVPAAAWLGLLTIEQLYAVVLLSGCATVFFDVGAQSYLPQLVGRDRLIQANAQLNGWDAALQAGGRGGGGFLVALLTAPVAVLANAFAFLWSALCLTRIRRLQEKPARDVRRNLAAEVGEGVRFVFGHAVLRPVALAGAFTNCSVLTVTTMVPVLFRDELGLSVWTIGVFLALGGVGVFLGALAARRVGEWLGAGRAPWIFGMCTAPFALAVPLLMGRGPWLWAAAGCWLLVTVRMGVDNVLMVSFRQRVTPDALLGRMNATMRFLFTGALAIGAGLAALIGEYVSVRAALWTGAVGLSVAWLPVFLSPLRTMRELPSE